jgi:glycerol-3-phosphate dehydrogenase
MVDPLPIVMPTYGHGLQGKVIMRAGMLLYDVLCADRNAGIADSSQQIPRGGTITRDECLALYPGLERRGLTGAAVFFDAQMYNPTRLVLAYLKSAVDLGAQVVNYVEVGSLMLRDGRVLGANVVDRLSGDRFEIRAKLTILAAGAWSKRIVPGHARLEQNYSRDACFVVGRRLFDGHRSLALQTRYKDPDAFISRGARHVFVTPWRDYTLIGVWHKVYKGNPDEVTVTEEELAGYLGEINSSYPDFDLSLDDVSTWNAGLVLFEDDREGALNLKFGKRTSLIDHAVADNVEGLVSLVGVRATTARAGGEKAVDLALAKLRVPHRASRTAETKVYGGDIGNRETFLSELRANAAINLEADVITGLGRNYGTDYKSVLNLASSEPCGYATIANRRNLQAEVLHAVRCEMAQNLSDVVFRRTDIATGGYPGDEALAQCVRLLSQELSWSKETASREVNQVRARFPSSAIN